MGNVSIPKGNLAKVTCQLVETKGPVFLHKLQLLCLLSLIVPLYHVSANMMDPMFKYAVAGCLINAYPPRMKRLFSLSERLKQ